MSRNVAFGWGVGLVGAVGILSGMTAGGQTAPAAAPVAATPAATVATTVQDYSQGFRAFIRMGVPDTSKAKYVKLDYYGGGMQDAMMYRMSAVQLSGNAWLISENKDGKSVIISSSGRTLELFDQKTYMKRQEAEARSNALAQATAAGKGDGKHAAWSVSFRGTMMAEAGSWIPTDLSRDLAKATAFLDKQIKAKAAGGREMRYDSFLQSDEPAGELFLLATFAWQNGKMQEANTLAGRLFTLVGDSRKVIVGALNVMADAELAGAADTFRTTHDWKTYSAEVAGLLKKYPAGWRQAGAVKLLADRLQARAAMTEPPAISGEGLDSEDMKLAAALASETNHAEMNGWNGELWILPPGKTMRGMKDDSALGRIKARGVKSIPLLIALVPDETLCPLRRNEVGLPVYTSYSDNDTQMTEGERAQGYYSRMDRPLTRGEIARAMLAPLCPHDETARHEEAEVAPDEVVETAKRTYAALKALPPSALAKHFMDKGDQSQKQAAVGYMLQNDIESNAPVIEAFFLTPPQDDSGSMGMRADTGLVQQYVQQRGEKAADFVEKYAAILKKVELPAGMADNAEYVKMMEKQADREIKTLRAMVKKQDLSESVTALANSGNESEVAMAAYTTLGRQKPAQALPALLAMAVKTTNVAVRARILQLTTMLRYAGLQESAQEEMSEAGAEGMEAAMKKLAEKNQLTIGTNAAEWKILLADTRAMPEGRMYSGGAYEWTVADLAATSIETLYGDSSVLEHYGRGGGAGNLRPEVMMKITRARAAARLEGTPEDQWPKMPSADDVTAERRKAIETDVMKATPAALGAVLDKLTDSESLYLAEAAGENEAIMKALSPLSRCIVSVKTAPSLPAAEAARLQKLTGTTVSTNSIAEMREICKRQLAAGAPFAITLSSSGLGRGLHLDVTPVDETLQRMYGSGYASLLSSSGGSRKGMVMGVLRNGENCGQGMWVVDLPAATNVAAGVASTGTVSAAAADSDENPEDRLTAFMSSIESQQEQFDTAVETFCKPDESLGPGASVSFTGLTPKEKDKKQGTDDEDEGDADMATPGGMIE